MGVTGILVRMVYGRQFPLNGIQISFTVSLLAACTYIVTALLTCRQDFNLKKSCTGASMRSSCRQRTRSLNRI